MNGMKPYNSEFADSTMIQQKLISHKTPFVSMLETMEMEHHGVFQKLRELDENKVPLNDPLVAMVLSEAELITFAFWADEPIFIDPVRTLIQGEQTYAKIVKDGIWSRAINWWEGFVFESEYWSDPENRLPVAEIHTPHIEGCVGTFATTADGALDVSIKAFGFGYQKFKQVTVDRSYEAKGSCCTLTTGVQFLVHILKQKFSDKRRAIIKRIDIDGNLICEPSKLSDPHFCGENYQNTIRNIKSLSQLRGQNLNDYYSILPMGKDPPGSIVGYSEKFKKDCVYSFSLELPMSWFSQSVQNSASIFKLGISIESRVSKTIAMGWKLMSGHNYLNFKGVGGDKRMFWLWD